ncbi:phytanoyl-CoA dioxygenase family protein [Acinetobacter calcoaceticus]|uniref:phytanoyl-CoA dioxygenase family protein n=1 Tax=Acinetobacter calcoaceticus TaxID=471 RepID=UPI0018DD1136|nr:phytanoyl-CoA dioxygenase family protein [Acinetobacter calcoaceticus]
MKQELESAVNARVIESNKLDGSSLIGQERQPDTDFYAALSDMGLGGHVAHLDQYGYCVVPPSDFDDLGLTAEAKRKVLEIAERRSGIRPDSETGATHSIGESAVGQCMHYLLFEDPVFEKMLIHPVVLAFHRYLLGRSGRLSAMSAMLRGPGTPALATHADLVMVPPPWPMFAQVCNISWALTDYTKENGATAIVPGSHKLCRPPTDAEIADTSKLIAVTAPAGSLVIWHGNTWHGSFAKVSPGLRMQIIMYMCRTHVMPQEWYLDKVTPEILQRNGTEFAEMLGIGHPYPFAPSGPDWQNVVRAFGQATTLNG